MKELFYFFLTILICLVILLISVFLLGYFIMPFGELYFAISLIIGLPFVISFIICPIINWFVDKI